MPNINPQDAPRNPAEQEKLRLIQNNFGAAAANYVTSKVHASGPDLAWLVEAAALTGTERVLDVATGGGHTAFALAPYAAEVVALDLTRPMLEVAQKEANARGFTNIHYLEGDAQNLPCEDASFDVVACRYAAHHFPRVRQAALEWARVLKPDGKLLLIDSTSPEEPEADALLHEIEMLRDPSHVRNYRISEWRTFLNEAGLMVNIAREEGTFLDIPSWTQRIRTPPEAVAAIEQLMRNASPSVRARLRIVENDGVLGFTLPRVLIRALKRRT
ncbi:MAG TPA: methyltransferase domain-containing protein [Ktedonobacteraceae bacterium]|nr:methyltransferase domain-containing protein [Ktedonobacteraceae bacterium]